MHYALLIFTLLLFLPNSHAQMLKVGDKAPSFSTHTINGKPVSLNQFLGKKPVYLKFWATWCHYCLAELPQLNAIATQYGNKVAVLAVNIGINDSIDNINAFYQENQLTLPTIFDKSGNLTQNYGVIGTPYGVIIDSDGKVALTSFLHSDKIERTLNALTTHQR